jgi:hypothetical protein
MRKDWKKREEKGVNLNGLTPAVTLLKERYGGAVDEIPAR